MLRTLQEDILALCTVLLSPASLDPFLPLVAKLESLLIAMLGGSQSHLRSVASVLLNVLYSSFLISSRRYDCHDWQLESPLPVTISEVGKPMTLEIHVENASNLQLCLCSPSSKSTMSCDVLAPRVFSTHPLHFSSQTYLFSTAAL